jgi:endonuclease YncB( thermonuclease family)
MASRPDSFVYAVFAAGALSGAMFVVAVSFGIFPATARGDASVPVVNTRTPLAGSYRAQVLNVIDGDTVEARVHVWMGQEVVTRVRLKDIDAPEVAGACGPERQQAIKARDRLTALVQGPGIVLAEVRPDKYFGRVVARIVMSDGQDAGAILLAEGLARPYRGGRRESWCPINPL